MQSNLANHLNNKSQKKKVRIREAPDQISEASIEDEQHNASQMRKQHMRRRTENPEELQNYITKIRCFSCGNDMNNEEVKMSMRMNAMFVEDVLHSNDRTMGAHDEGLDQEHYCYKCFYEYVAPVRNLICLTHSCSFSYRNFYKKGRSEGSASA